MRYLRLGSYELDLAWGWGHLLYFLARLRRHMLHQCLECGLPGLRGREMWCSITCACYDGFMRVDTKPCKIRNPLWPRRLPLYLSRMYRPYKRPMKYL